MLTSEPTSGNRISDLMQKVADIETLADAGLEVKSNLVAFPPQDNDEYLLGRFNKAADRLILFDKMRLAAAFVLCDIRREKRIAELTNNKDGAERFEKMHSELQVVVDFLADEMKKVKL
jgi:hypothetical protein